MKGIQRPQGCGAIREEKALGATMDGGRQFGTPATLGESVGRPLYRPRLSG